MARPKVTGTKQPGIYKLTYPSGQVRYRVHVHRNGKQTTDTFHAFNDAIHFKRTNDSHHDTKGLPFTNRLLDKTSLRSIVDRYREGGVNIRGKPLGSTELVYTKKFSQWLEDNDDPSLTAFDEEMASDYVDELLARTWKGKGWKGSVRPVEPSSVRRHINAIQPIWKMARRKWGFKGLENPFEDTDIEGSDVISMRHLKPGELEKLIAVAREYSVDRRYSNIGMSTHRFYVPLSLNLGLHTGMRREEIFDLTWENVDWKNRRIYIRKAKKGPRLIVMPMIVLLELMRLRMYLFVNGAFNSSDYVMYPRETKIGTKGKMKGKRLAIQNNEDVLWEIRKRAGLYIEDRKDRWTFRCLRKEAEARFLSVLTLPEADRMMGHKNNKNMAMRYWVTNNEDLVRIQEKLDKSVRKSETAKEEILNEVERIQKITKDMRSKLNKFDLSPSSSTPREELEQFLEEETNNFLKEGMGENTRKWLKHGEASPVTGFIDEEEERLKEGEEYDEKLREMLGKIPEQWEESGRLWEGVDEAKREHNRFLAKKRRMTFERFKQIYGDEYTIEEFLSYKALAQDEDYIEKKPKPSDK